MRAIRFTLLICSVLTFQFLSASNKSIDEDSKYAKLSSNKLLSYARKAAINEEYETSKELFLLLLKKDSTNPLYNYEFGLNLLLSPSDQKKSLYYFQTALQHSTKDTIPKLYYYLGVSHNLNLNYDQAIQNYSNYKRSLSNKNSIADINDKIEKCRLGNSYQLRANKWMSVDNLGGNINTSESEYAPVVKADESVMYYTASRKNNAGGEKDESIDRYFEDMYISKGDSGVFHFAEKFAIDDSQTKKLKNTGEHESVVSLSYDEKYLITYKGNALYWSEWINNSWSRPQKFPKNINLGQYQNHASFSAHNDTLYFSSNAKGGFGGLDIYMCVKENNGLWGKAMNLGPNINTNKDEDSPTIGIDNHTLYYSSKGHESIGGYDIFKCDYKNGAWSSSENMGAPINSPSDDLYFKLDKYNKQAYFASSRINGIGDFDIYRLINYEEPHFEDCKTQAFKGDFPVTFDAGSLISIKNDIAQYHWEFSDGENTDGKVVTHYFAEAGLHKAKLYVLDPIVHKLIEEIDTVVTVVNISKLHFTSADTTSIDSVVIFNNAPKKLERSSILKYQWSFGDLSDLQEGPLAEHRYAEPGNYEVKLSLINRDDSTTQIYQKCITKMVSVLSTVDYVAYSNKVNARKKKKFGLTTELLGKIQFDILAPDTTTINMEDIFDATPVFIPNTTILGYSWDFGTARPLVKNPMTTNSFLNTGLFKVKLNLIYQVDSSKAIYETQVFKNVAVVEKNTFQKIAKQRNKRQKLLAQKVSKNKSQAKEKTQLVKQSNIAEAITKPKIDQAIVENLNANKSVLETIYFNFNSSKIRSDAEKILLKNVAVLKRDTSLVFKIIATADARGSDEYNYKLSQKRAKAVKAFYLSHTIDANRIIAMESVGESKPVNNCLNDIKCSEKEQEHNRRAEFPLIDR